MIKNISNLGDAAVYCDFGLEVNETINSNVIDYFDHLSKLVKEKKIQGITNLTPSYNKLIVSFDLNLTNYKETKDIIKNLQLRGHIIKTYGYMGVANGIIISDDGFYGGGDCRDETSALGY